MAQGEPRYGPHDGELPVAAFADGTLGQVYHDDPNELLKIAKLAPAYKKRRIMDVSDLEQATLSQHDAAIGDVYTPRSMRGARQLILKYLGKRGVRHVPPPEEEARGGVHRVARPDGGVDPQPAHHHGHSYECLHAVGGWRRGFQD